MSAGSEPVNPPRRQDFYALRFIATGFAFFTFGLFGLLFRLLAYPPLLLVRTPDRRRRIARSLIRGFFRAFIGMLRLLGVLTLSVENRSGLATRGSLVVANHPSLLDVVLLVALTPDACCVVKKELWSNPFMNGPLRAAGYIDNGDPVAMLEAAQKDLAAGSPIIIFPEGTRTERGGRPVFGRSAANLSVRSGRPVIPVFIAVDPTTLTRNEHWYEVPYRRVRFRLSVGAAFDPAHAGNPGEPVTLRVRRQQEQIVGFMAQMLGERPSDPQGRDGGTNRTTTIQKETIRKETIRKDLNRNDATTG